MGRLRHIWSSKPALERWPVLSDKRIWTGCQINSKNEIWTYQMFQCSFAPIWKRHSAQYAGVRLCRNRGFSCTALGRCHYFLAKPVLNHAALTQTLGSRDANPCQACYENHTSALLPAVRGGHMAGLCSWWRWEQWIQLPTTSDSCIISNSGSPRWIYPASVPSLPAVSSGCIKVATIH